MEHTPRQWMVTHEWMVKPQQQTEWIKGRGLLIWLTEVFGALGTGLYLVSIVFGNLWGALFGYLIVLAIKLPIHLAYLGQPTRFWRMLPPFTPTWRTSWIARGFFFTTLFAGFGFIHLLIGFLTEYGLVADAGFIAFLDVACRFLGGIFGFLTAIYTGFMLSFCKSIPFWNTGLLPIVVLITGIADGFALIVAVGLLGLGDVDIHYMEAVTRVLLLLNIFLIGTYLLNSTYRSDTAKLSAYELLTGKNAVTFWVGVCLSGILIPLAISLAGYALGDVHPAIQIFAVICHTIGAFSLKYVILDAGIYKPIIPRR